MCFQPFDDTHLRVNKGIAWYHGTTGLASAFASDAGCPVQVWHDQLQCLPEEGRKNKV